MRLKPYNLLLLLFFGSFLVKAMSSKTHETNLSLDARDLSQLDLSKFKVGIDPRDEAACKSVYKELSGQEFNVRQIMTYISDLNTLRNYVAHVYGVPNMLKVQSLCDAAVADQRFLAVAKSWIYDDIPDNELPGGAPPCGTNRVLNYARWSHNETYIAIVKSIPSLEEKLSGLTVQREHDTINMPLSNALSRIVPLRFIRQIHCYQPTQCIPGEFCNFEGCFNENSSQGCAGGPQSYMGRAIYPPVKFSYVVNQHQTGRFAPASQKGNRGDSFEMPFYMDEADWEPLENTPLSETGKVPASECPPTHPYPEQNLCSALPPIPAKSGRRLRI